MHKLCRQALGQRGMRYVTSSRICLESNSSPPEQPDLPDLTTSVNIHEHKLSKPAGPPQKQKKIARWKELETLKETTKVR